VLWPLRRKIPAGRLPRGAKIACGSEGRWNYLTVDPDGRRMYISRSTHVMVVDEDSGKVVGDIADTKGNAMTFAPNTIDNQ